MLDWLQDTFLFLTNVQGIITWGGVVLVCIIIFVETGLFFGFFLPGDSLLVTAGIFAAAGYLDLFALLFFGSMCAVLGDQVGYFIGRKTGRALYNRPNSRFFKQQHLERTRAFYEKYGAKTIVLARFVPIVRTFAPAVAGAAEMRYRRFVTYNVFGGILWIFSMTLIGYFLGTFIPNIDRYIHWVIAVVVFLSILPAIVEVLRARQRPAKTEAALSMRKDL
ncbi:MAG: VTT domain-containing protein [Acidobacteria bacterium]|nr:VTT domain-containing protein [Acidobacteriota bacterium]